MLARAISRTAVAALSFGFAAVCLPSQGAEAHSATPRHVQPARHVSDPGRRPVSRPTLGHSFDSAARLATLLHKLHKLRGPAPRIGTAGNPRTGVAWHAHHSAAWRRAATARRAAAVQTLAVQQGEAARQKRGQLLIQRSPAGSRLWSPLSSDVSGDGALAGLDSRLAGSVGTQPWDLRGADLLLGPSDDLSSAIFAARSRFALDGSLDRAPGALLVGFAPALAGPPVPGKSSTAGVPARTDTRTGPGTAVVRRTAASAIRPRSRPAQAVHAGRPPVVARGSYGAYRGAVASVAAKTKGVAIPVLLILVLLGFLIVQRWIDRRDPKLSRSSAEAEPDLRFG